MGEEQVAPITSLIHGNDNLGQQLLDKAKKSWKRRALPNSNREVHSNGLIAAGRQNKDLSRVEGFNACYVNFKGDVKVCCKMRKVFLGEMELKGVEGIRGDKGGNFEHGNG
ncbi:hypothetical protein IEQ34_022852 [Dendrobium chrysotoxum]|uniref:Uncharacterized protein n=1 Tax=Dendrobium chrysotoxum TaxID=161865 RepID=A0AAV7FYW2_DENCH|nr:hypothetical protein IEQ34_022852 [Dendrobium chrysotoxum]